MKKILAIDNQKDNLSTIESIINSNISDCKILTALSVKEGLKIAREEKPDTILLDIIMPKINGYELCKKLKEDELTKHIPIVMLTDINTDISRRVKSLNIGVDAFLSKPIDAIELTAQLNVMLRIKKAEDKLSNEKKVLDEKYRNIIEATSEGFWLFDSENKIIDVNKSLCDMLAYSKDEIIGKTPVEFYDEENLKILNSQIYRSNITKQKNFEIFLKKKNGIKFPTLFNATSLFNDKGNKDGFFAFVTDITEQKKSEDEIREISETAIQLVNFPTNKNIYDFICLKMKEFIGDGVVVVNSIDQKKNIMQTQKVLGFAESMLKLFKNILGSKFTDISFSDIPPVVIDSYKSGKLIKIEGGLYEVFFRKVPKILCTQINKKIGIKKIYSIGLRQEGEIFGNIVIFSKAKTRLNKNIIETFANQASNAMSKRRFEEELQESEIRFKKLSSFTIEGILINNKGVTIDVNESLINMFGYTKEEVLGKNVINLCVPEEYHSKIMENINKNIATPYNVIGRKKDGTLIPVEIEAREINFNNEKFRVSAIRDITNRKNAEKALKKSEEMIQNIFENSTCLYYSYTPDYLYTYLSPQVKNFLGYSKDELLFKWTELLSDNPTNKNGIKNTVEAIKTGKRQAPYELELIKKNGEKIWVEVREFPQVENDKTKAIIGSLTNITKRKYANQIQEVLYNISNAVIITHNLKDFIDYTQKELGKIIDTTNYYIALYDSKTDTLSVPYFADEKDNITSFPAGKTLTYYVIKTKKSLFGTKEIIRQLEISGEVEQFGEDSEIWLGVPLKVEGKVTGVLAVQSYSDENAYNESDMKILEFVSQQISISINHINTGKKLEKALVDATESERLKSAFLANMSHEIRTPMNGILGFTDLLKEPKFSGDEKKQFIEIIENSGKRMLNTINDLVDISKVEAGQMKVSLKEVNINSQTEYLYTFFKPEVEKKGMKLFLKNSLPQTETIIITDKEKVYAILTNLIKNAIKYTHEGSIEFGFYLNKKSKPAELEFFVKDTGIGIPANRQKAIFDRFVQADIEDREAYEGTGLGLSISKAYVEMLGGKIWVESENCKGSQFYFTLPYNIGKMEKLSIRENLSKKVSEKKIKDLKILIVEDEFIACNFLTIILKNIAREFIFAKTGVEAIEVYQKNLDIDLILMDIGIPKIDGYEVTKQIRKVNKDVIIIAQTAFALSGDRYKALEAGCNDYISKPINKNKLLEMIENNFDDLKK